jgi:prevent-host-death family protein
MQKTVAAADLGKRFRAVFNEVTEDHVPYVVTRDQQPEAVLVPYDEFQRLLKDSDNEVLRRFDEVRARIRERTAGFSEEEVAADVAAARAGSHGTTHTAHRERTQTAPYPDRLSRRQWLLSG